MFLEISSAITQLLQNGFSGIVDDLLSVLAVAVPAVFGVVGIFFVVRKVIYFFQSSAAKAESAKDYADYGDG